MTRTTCMNTSAALRQLTPSGSCSIDNKAHDELRWRVSARGAQQGGLDNELRSPLLGL